MMQIKNIVLVYKFSKHEHFDNVEWQRISKNVTIANHLLLEAFQYWQIYSSLRLIFIESGGVDGEVCLNLIKFRNNITSQAFKARDIVTFSLLHIYFSSI